MGTKSTKQKPENKPKEIAIYVAKGIIKGIAKNAYAAFRFGETFVKRLAKLGIIGAAKAAAKVVAKITMAATVINVLIVDGVIYVYNMSKEVRRLLKHEIDFSTFMDNATDLTMKTIGSVGGGIAGLIGGSALGAALGTLIPIPFIGSAVGGIVGGIIGSLAVGKICELWYKRCALELRTSRVWKEAISMFSNCHYLANYRRTTGIAICQ